MKLISHSVLPWPSKTNTKKTENETFKSEN